MNSKTSKTGPPPAVVPAPDDSSDKKKKKKRAEGAEDAAADEPVAPAKVPKPTKTAEEPKAPAAGPSKPAKEQKKKEEKEKQAAGKSATPAKAAPAAAAKPEASKQKAKAAPKAAPKPPAAPADSGSETEEEEEAPPPKAAQPKAQPKPKPKPQPKPQPAAASDEEESEEEAPPAKKPAAAALAAKKAAPAAKAAPKAAAKAAVEEESETEEEAPPAKASKVTFAKATPPKLSAAGARAEKEGGEEEPKRRGRAKLTEEQREASERRRKGLAATLKALSGAASGKELPFPLRAPLGTSMASREPVCPCFNAHDESGAAFRASLLALASVEEEHERAWRVETTAEAKGDRRAGEKSVAEADTAAAAMESRVDEFVERAQRLLPALRRSCIIPDDLSKQPPASLVASLLAFVQTSKEVAELAGAFTTIVNRYWSDYLAPRDEAEEPGPLAGEPNLKVLGKLPVELRELLPTPAGATDLVRAGRGLGRQVAAFHDAHAAAPLAPTTPAEKKKRGRPSGAKEEKERKKRPLTEHEQRAVVAFFESAASDYAAEHPEDPRGCFRKDGEYSGFAPWIYEMIKELKAQHPELADVHPGTIKGVGCTQFKEYADAMLAQIKKAQAGRRKKGEEAEAEAAPAPAAEEEPAKKKKKKPAAPAAEDDD